MGWMHDTLRYMQHEAIHRKFHHHELTFRRVYAYHERFVLPLSHDEVVYGKGSLLGRMPGDTWQKYANLRLLYAYMFAISGKPLLFMGGEFGQWREWNYDSSLDWHLLDDPLHGGLRRFVQDLNRTYTTERALHEVDFEGAGFSWIDCNDSDNSVVSLVRRAKSGEFVVAIVNFTPVPRDGYRIGVPAAGAYTELVNSDSAAYGGSNVGGCRFRHLASSC
jgi:1,4-alpha-glucan branching enzyme